MDARPAPPPALVAGHQRLSRAGVAARAVSEAHRLRSAGVGPGDRVVLAGENSVELVVGLLALAHLDASIVLVDGRVPPAELDAWARLVGARRTWVAGGTDPDPDPAADTAAEPHPDTARAALDLDAWARRRDALVVRSSGSTGAPHGVVRSGASIMGNTARTAARMGYRADDVLLPLVPFTHQYGMSLVLLWWHTPGARLVIGAPHRGDRALDAVVGEGVTIVDGTPWTYRSLLRLIAARPRDTSGVRMWCVGGAPLEPDLARRFERLVGSPLLDGYGASETGNIALAAPAGPQGCGTALDGVTIEVHDDAGRPVAPGVEGEVVVTTPDLMTALIDTDGREHAVAPGAFRTRDHGRIEPDGGLVVLGRRQAVHRLGHTLYPEALAARVERYGCPVRVLAFDSERVGTQLVFAVADPEHRGARYWRRLFADTLAVHEVPNRVVVLAGFPLTHSGKVDGAALRALVEVELAIGRREDGAPAPAPEPGPAPGVARPERLALLRAAAEVLRRRRPEVATILEQASHRRTVDGEIDAALETLEGAPEEMARFRPGPVARAAVFMPSNIALYAYVLYLLVPSLYIERLTFRASRQIAPVTHRLHALFASELDLPIEASDASQRRFVAGPVAEAGVVVFTGTYENAESVRQTLRPEQVLLFYGQGVNPFVVDAGADLDAAVDDLVSIRLFNSGQDCFGPDVVPVDARVADEFLARLGERVRALRCGPHADPDADYSPMFYRQAFALALDYLQRHAEHIVAGGTVDLGSRHVTPTVLELPRHPKGMYEEMFAPIFNVVRYEDPEQLAALLFSPWCADRAMGATVYGDLPELVERLGRRHEVTVNRTLFDADDGNAPFGGRGIVAGYVAHGKRRVSEPLLMSKVVADRLGVLPAPLAVEALRG